MTQPFAWPHFFRKSHFMGMIPIYRTNLLYLIRLVSRDVVKRTKVTRKPLGKANTANTGAAKNQDIRFWGVSITCVFVFPHARARTELNTVHLFLWFRSVSIVTQAPVHRSACTAIRSKEIYCPLDILKKSFKVTFRPSAWQQFRCSALVICGSLRACEN